MTVPHGTKSRFDNVMTIYTPLQKHLGRPCQEAIYWRCLNFQELRKWDGPEFPIVFLNPSKQTLDVTTSHWPRTSTHPLRCRRLIACQSPPTPGSQRLGWTHPPLQRLFSLWKSLSPGRDGKKQYSCFSSARSLHIVVEDARINLSVSRRWHKLELGSIHKNWAVLGTICVI